jgi:hypothetical protein
MNPFSQAAGTPGIKTTVNATLPVGADNQPVVQIRWALWRGSETGNSSGLAIDNIAVNSTTISNSIAMTVTPDTVNESAGANAATVTVTTSSPVATDLPVTLTSSDITEAIVDITTVVIPAGASTATFTVRAVDDDVVDGPQFVTLQAISVLPRAARHPWLIGTLPGQLDIERVLVRIVALDVNGRIPRALRPRFESYLESRG